MDSKDARKRRLVDLAMHGVILTPVAAEDLKGVWTRFQAIPGDSTEPWDEIFIQAPTVEAMRIFSNIFNHSWVAGGYASFELENPRDYAAQVVRGVSLFIKDSDILPEWRQKKES